MKKFCRFIKAVATNFWVQLVVLLACIVGIFAVACVMESDKTLGAKILEFVTSGDIISILLAAFVSITVARITFKAMSAVEESRKLENDHHKIVCKYFSHSKDKIDYERNYCNKDGSFMYLTKVPQNRKKQSNPEANKESSDYITRREEIEAYCGGKLYLPVLTVFTNTRGDTQMRFHDSRETFTLPTFVRENVLALMHAHFVSDTTNGDTVRLNDFSYDGNTVTLDTMRTHYFDMLVTNRCMDYKLDNVVTLREVYEYNSTVTPLRESQLSNQIGLNGLIFTNNGYLLLEKRGRKKAVWKNKFAQPISLAMKTSNLVDPKGGIGPSQADAENNFKNTVLTTIGNNFGFTEEDIVSFHAQTNFLGIARDLLEGGKPNLYCYVVVDKSAEEMKEYLERKAKSACARENDASLPKFTKAKLESEFYLVNYRDIAIDYHYALKVKARKVYRVKRKYAPIVSRARQCFDGSVFRWKRAFHGSIKKQCGEALLSCLYYVDACRKRIDLQTDISDYDEKVEAR